MSMANSLARFSGLSITKKKILQDLAAVSDVTVCVRCNVPPPLFVANESALMVTLRSMRACQKRPIFN